MDFNATVDLIIKDLNEAREIIDDLKNYPGVPLIQVEMAKSKCKSAAEIIALLKTMQNSAPLPEQKPVTKQESELSVKPEMKPEKDVIHKVPHIKKVVPEKLAGKSTESAIIADTFGLSDRINEKMGSLRDEDDLSDIIKSKPLTKLSEAIGVNDKFLFIRELFDGNPEAYNQAISRLDNAENFEDAKGVIMSYSSDNKDTDAIRQLLDLVKRKFPSDE